MEITDPKSAKGRLLQTAAHLFRVRGFDRTTVRDLASAVGIQSGSIFHHFKNKNEILEAVMRDTIVYNTRFMIEGLRKADSTRDQLLALIRCELDSINGVTGEAMNVLVFEWRNLPEEKQQSILELRGIYEGLWLAVLEDAASIGLVNGHPSVLRRLLTGALSWTSTWYRKDGPLTVEQLSEQVLQMIVRD
ncbi:TetR/AcrR family transcriptional regulator [Aestuariirhabdus sp. Z084]|nr:TetR/AcrR family transcriptional regulator [Aestuariirhabdus haliotis]MCL6418647.1 TetR/AcrR family transcriptional regulator [Aestuariirhabdus haliotis]